MSKNNAKDSSKVTLSAQSVDRAARVLCKAMARSNGTSMGDVISEALWEKANKFFHPATIKMILNREGIAFDLD